LADATRHFETTGHDVDTYPRITRLETAGLPLNDPRHVRCDYQYCDQVAGLLCETGSGPALTLCVEHAAEFSVAWHATCDDPACGTCYEATAFDRHTAEVAFVDSTWRAVCPCRWIGPERSGPHNAMLDAMAHNNND